MAVTRISLFVSSPQDVAAERDRVDRVVAHVNNLMREVARFEVIRWEKRYYQAHDSFQPQIPDSTDCDLVVGILWSRLGTPLPEGSPLRADGSAYPSGTAFELETAILARRERGAPDVYVFRKSAEVRFSAHPEQMQLEQAQYLALQDFWQEWFQDASGRFVGAFQSFADASEFERRLEECLLDWLGRRGLEPRPRAWDIDTLGSPFRGLQAFDEGHERVFFGRKAAVGLCWNRLLEATERGTPFLLIVGASGSGKSSMVSAGIVPRFRLHHNVSGLGSGVVVRTRPGVDAPRQLALALAGAQDVRLESAMRGCAAELEGLVRERPGALAKHLADALSRVDALLEPRGGLADRDRCALLLVVDQFEEVFEQEAALQAAFAAALRALVAVPRVAVVCTLRVDRYAEFIGNDDLLALKSLGVTFDTHPPSHDELAEIVRSPALAAELSYEVDAAGVDLADRILDDVEGADALPLLQLTLDSLFQHRESGSRLSHAAYALLGGVRGAVSAAAERAYLGVDAESRQRLPVLLSRLTAGFNERGEAQGRVTRMADVDQDPALLRLVRALMDARLLILDLDRPQQRESGLLRVTHEALLRTWPRAVQLLQELHDAIEVRERLRPHCSEWQAGIASGQSGRALLGDGPLLSAALAIAGGAHADMLDHEQRRYIEASREALEGQRRRRRREVGAVIAGLSMLLLLALGAAMVAWQQSQQARAGLAASLRAVNGLSQDVAVVLREARGIRAESVEQILNAANAVVDDVAAYAAGDQNFARARVAMHLEFVRVLLNLARRAEAARSLLRAHEELGQLRASGLDDDELRALEFQILSQQALLAWYELDLDAAQAHARRALEGFDRLLAGSGVRREWVVERARAAQHLALTLRTADQADEAIELLQSAIAQLSAHPGASALDADVGARLVSLKVGLGSALVEARRLAEGAAILELVDADAERVLERHPALAEVAQMRLRAGNERVRVLYQQGKIQQGLELASEVELLAQRLLQGDPLSVVLGLELQSIHNFQATLHEYAGDQESRVRALRRGVDIMRGLAERDRANSYLLGELSFVERRLSVALQAGNDLVGATAHLNEAMQIDRQLIAKQPSRPFARRYLSASLLQKSVLDFESGDDDAALAAATEAVELRRGLAAQFPTEVKWRWLLAQALMRQARLQREDPEATTQVLDVLREATTLTAQAVAQESESLVDQWTHWNGVLVLAQTLSDQKSWDQAAAALDDAIAGLGHIADSGSDLSTEVGPDLARARLERELLALRTARAPDTATCRKALALIASSGRTGDAAAASSAAEDLARYAELGDKLGLRSQAAGLLELVQAQRPLLRSESELLAELRAGKTDG